MELFTGLLVGKPLNIFVVAAVFGVTHVARRILGSDSDPKPTRALLIAAAGWGLYAAWEWLVTARSPEADIRVDLLFIWPVLAALTVWCVVSAFR